MISLKGKYKSYIKSIALALVIFVAYLWIQDIFSGEEGRVRKFVLQGKKVIEAKNILGLTQLIADDYHDKYGNDRQTLLYIFREVFGYYSQILVHIESIEVSLDDSKTSASVEILALVIGKTAQNNTEKILEGEKGAIKLRLIKEEKIWKLQGVESFEAMTIMGQNIS